MSEIEIPAGVSPGVADIVRQFNDQDPAVRTWAESLATSADQAASTSALLRRLTDEADQIRADYNAVLLELSAARAAASWIVARDGGRHCERCEAEVTRGQAYELQDGTVGLVAHVHCPEPAAPLATETTEESK